MCAHACVHPGIHLCAHVYVYFSTMPHGLMRSSRNWRGHLHSLILKCLLKHKVARYWCRVGYWETVHLVSRQALVLEGIRLANFSGWTSCQRSCCFVFICDSSA